VILSRIKKPPDGGWIFGGKPFEVTVRILRPGRFEHC
jgi:hypothetical protein